VSGVTLDRARESLQAAELCLGAGLVNSATSRAYYAMFQAAQVGLNCAGVGREEWSHWALQSTFVTELIHRRKIYPAAFAEYLSSGLEVRLIADYSAEGVSQKRAQRQLRRARSLLAAVERETTRAQPSS
jgi:uncharacterized protein (UPF0332 family)